LGNAIVLALFHSVVVLRISPQQVWQLGDVARYASSFVLGRRLLEPSHKKEPLQANGVNVDLRWFPADVSISYLYGSMLYPKAPLTAVVG
jgi:hypothetical protein